MGASFAPTYCGGMCGRYAAAADTAELVEIFEIDEVTDPAPPPAYNVAPTDPVAAVVERIPREHDASSEDDPPVPGVRKLVQLRWGLVPSWAKDPTGGARMINARFETVAEKPAFRKAFRSRRCLLPAAGYYEWYDTGEQTPRGKPVKQPYFIHRADSGLLVMAGLYEFWRDPSRRDEPGGGWLTTCTIITTAATDAVGHLHDRMPMVVADDHWDAWLDPYATDAEAAHHLLAVTPPQELAAYPVSTAVNQVRNDGPELIDPLL